jgi:3-oxoacyl-[acyl-carrier protein] reductase
MRTGGHGRLDGKTIVVTGAAHGIGKAYARRLVDEGAHVVVCDIDGAALELEVARLKAAGGDIIGRRADVRGFEAMEELAALAAERSGRIDGLVNNAGMLVIEHVSHVPFREIPEDEWDAVFATNVKSVWTVCRAVTPYMLDGKGGSIVNVSSAAVFKATETRAHYVATKAAIIGLSRVLAKELGKDWIRVNTVAPGAVLSEEDPDEATIRNREKASATRALQRIEYPEDVTGTVVFLLSDDSAFVTGQVIVVDGGAVVH